MLRGAARLAARLAVAAIVLMMFVGAADVALTWFGQPIPGAFELTESLMVACVFLAIAHAQSNNQHIRVDVLPRAFAARGRAVLDVIAHVASFALYGAIAFYGWREFGASVADGEFAAGILKFALWPARLALALGATLMALQVLADLAGAAQRVAGR